MNKNIISERWNKTYLSLSDEKKEKIDALNKTDPAKYQLLTIKRNYSYPQIGDVFIVKPRNDICLYGLVLNNHISNNNGEEQLCVIIMKNGMDISFVSSRKNHLLPPIILTDIYWKKGFFTTVCHIDKITIDSYGFYSIGKGKIFDEYGNELNKTPKLIGTYGVSTIYGVAMEINRELIVSGLI